MSIYPVSDWEHNIQAIDQVITNNRQTIAWLEAEIASLRHALEACAAWHWSEREGGKHGFTFRDNMELCNYSEWKTIEALGISDGTDYQGVPRIVLGMPGFTPDLIRETEAEARARVDQIIALWKTTPARASEPAPGTTPEER